MVYATTGYTIAVNGQTLVVAAPTVGGTTGRPLESSSTW